MSSRAVILSNAEVTLAGSQGASIKVNSKLARLGQKKNKRGSRDTSLFRPRALIRSWNRWTFPIVQARIESDSSSSLRRLGVIVSILLGPPRAPSSTVEEIYSALEISEKRARSNIAGFHGTKSELNAARQAVLRLANTWLHRQQKLWSLGR